MRFKEALDHIEGLRFVADRMELLSEPGRDYLMNLRLRPEELRREHFALIEAKVIIEREEQRSDVETLFRLFMQTRNIRHTIERLAEGRTLDDVELFEVKNLAITAFKIYKVRFEWYLNYEYRYLGKYPQGLMLEDVVKLLDPENTGSRSFHVYSSYSPQLAALRRRLQQTSDEEERDRLTGECLILEETIRERLSRELAIYSERMADALEEIGWLDLLFAKAKFALKYNLRLPETEGEKIAYLGLRYLPAEARMKEEGKEFQPIDITLEKGVTLITGANMGGKSITLKSLALAQAMAEYGMPVAASAARICPVKAVETSMGDSQSALTGLSSFGAEILTIDGILKRSAERGCNLILIDEPGRTTNPDEGRRIVNALVGILSRRDAFTVITTHYSGIRGARKRLRVRGLTPDAGEKGMLSPATLGACMDYSLEEDTAGDIPREALRIARLLGVSRELIEEIENNKSII